MDKKQLSNEECMYQSMSNFVELCRINVSESESDVFLCLCQDTDIGIDTKIEVIVASPTTWEAHHSPRAKPEGCGELPRSLVMQQ